MIRELRKRNNANAGLSAFIAKAKGLLSHVICQLLRIGELRRGIEMIRHRGDSIQAEAMTDWYPGITDEFAEYILPIDKKMYLSKQNHL